MQIRNEQKFYRNNEKDIQMVNKHVLKGLSALIVKLQMKIIMRQHNVPTKRAEIKD